MKLTIKLLIINAERNIRYKGIFIILITRVIIVKLLKILLNKMFQMLNICQSYTF